MKRQFIFSLVILTCQFVFAEQEVATRPEVLNMMYTLWEDSGFGKDPNRTERAAWIVNDSPNRYRFIRWPRSAARNREFWYEETPQNSIALIHTHTEKVDPRPAVKDIKLAKRIRIPIYTISSGGIWIADRNGIVVKVYGPGWYKNLRKEPFAYSVRKEKSEKQNLDTNVTNRNGRFSREERRGRDSNPRSEF